MLTDLPTSKFFLFNPLSGATMYKFATSEEMAAGEVGFKMLPAPAAGVCPAGYSRPREIKPVLEYVEKITQTSIPSTYQNEMCKFMYH